MAGSGLTALERTVLRRLLAEPEAKPARPLDLDAVTVTERDLTGAGFFVHFARSPRLRLFDAATSMRWGSATAWLNGSSVQAGFLGYVDDGYLTCLEGYTLQGDWPDEVVSSEVV